MMDALTRDLARLQRQEEDEDAFLDWCEANSEDPEGRDTRRRYEFEQQRAAADWADAQEDY